MADKFRKCAGTVSTAGKNFESTSATRRVQPNGGGQSIPASGGGGQGFSEERGNKLRYQLDSDSQHV